MRDQFIKFLTKIAQNEKRVMLITGDLGFGVFDRFKELCPNQFLNAGVAEQNMTALATGLALEGYIVFTYSIANFSTIRCLEHIRNDSCFHNANVKIVSIGGGFSYGPLGTSHHATEDLAIMRSIPNMTVVAPCGLWETARATEALIDYPGTCFLRLDKSSGEDKPQDVEEKFRLGYPRIIREGKDLTIFVIGGILEEVLFAADALELDGISVQILSVHTLKPIEANLIIDACRKTKRVVTVEEHTLCGGLGSTIAEILLDYGVDTDLFLRIGISDVFPSTVGDQKYLRGYCGLDAKNIFDRIKKGLDNGSNRLI